MVSTRPNHAQLFHSRHIYRLQKSCLHYEQPKKANCVFSHTLWLSCYIRFLHYDQKKFWKWRTGLKFLFSLMTMRTRNFQKQGGLLNLIRTKNNKERAKQIAQTVIIMEETDNRICQIVIIKRLRKLKRITKQEMDHQHTTNTLVFDPQNGKKLRYKKWTRILEETMEATRKQNIEGIPEDKITTYLGRKSFITNMIVQGKHTEQIHAITRHRTPTTIHKPYSQFHTNPALTLPNPNLTLTHPLPTNYYFLH